MRFSLALCGAQAVPMVISTTGTRTLRASVREYELARSLFKQGTVASLHKIITLSRKSKISNEVSSRIAAFGVALAIEKNRLHDAETLLGRLEYSPSVLSLSLTICLLCKQGKLDEALDKLETCLNETDSVFNAANSQVSDEALDAIHLCISSRSDSSRQMKRFRSLQRIITSYGRRNRKRVVDLLDSNLGVLCLEDSRVQPTALLTDKVIEQTPSFLMPVYDNPRFDK